jgi:hypothetical protein
MQLWTNNAISKLNQNISDTDMTLTVLPGTGNYFPNIVNSDDYFLVTLEDTNATKLEIVKIVNRVGDVFTIGQRGYEGTTPQSWTTDDFVDHRQTAEGYNKFERFRIPGKTTRNLLCTPGNFVIADTYQTTLEKRSGKWLITIKDIVNNNISMFEMLIAYRSPLLSPYYNVYGKIGDNISYTIEVFQSGNNINIKITNNDVNTLSINILRIEYL